MSDGTNISAALDNKVYIITSGAYLTSHLTFSFKNNTKTTSIAEKNIITDLFMYFSFFANM